MFMAVFICGLTRSLTKLLHHVVRGLPIAVHAGDEVVSGFQLVIRVVTKVEDVGFTKRVEVVVEIVRGVGGIGERALLMAISARGRASYQLSPLKWATRRSCFMVWLVRSARPLVWGWYAVEAM